MKIELNMPKTMSRLAIIPPTDCGKHHITSNPDVVWLAADVSDSQAMRMAYLMRRILVRVTFAYDSTDVLGDYRGHNER